MDTSGVTMKKTLKKMPHCQFADNKATLLQMDFTTRLMNAKL